MADLAVGVGESVAQSTAIVIEALGTEWRVRTSAGNVLARRAASCHLVPSEGDLVVVAVLETGTAYIVAVLEREGVEHEVLRFDADVRLEGKNVVVAAKEELEQRAPRVSTKASSWTLNATRAQLQTQAMNVVSQSLETAFHAAQITANTAQLVADRFTERSKYHFRYVDELERVKAHAVNWLVSKAFHMAAENAVVQAAELVKADGKQVHIG